MVAKFCTSGEQEGLKGGVHAAACGLAVIMTAYNTTAWWYRRERHLGVNTVVYATAAAWEVIQVRRHWIRWASMRACVRTPGDAGGESMSHSGSRAA